MASCLWLTGCFAHTRVEHETVRGAPKRVEGPVNGATFHAQTQANEGGVSLTLSPAECSSYTETPVTTREVTYRKNTAGSAILGAVIGAGFGGLGYLLWHKSEDRPSECPDDMPKCQTKAGARAGAIVMWGLGAAALGYGTYRSLAPESRSDGPPSTTVERSPVARRPCSESVSGVPVSLNLPLHGLALRATTDAAGRAFFALSDDVLARLYRSSRATFEVGGRQVGEVVLSEPFRAWQLRTGARYGSLTYNDLVASSGSFSGTELAVEAVVSPRDDHNAFVGSVLPEEAFRFDDVRLSSLAGDSFPVALSVARVDVARPGDHRRDVVVLLDSSGSMKGNDGTRRGRIEGARAVFDELSEDTQVAVLDFGAGTSAGLNSAKMLQDFTADDEALRRSLGAISERGGTPMYSALWDAMELLKTRGGTGTIVVLTDGAADDRHAHDEIVERARQQGVTLFTVGLGPSLDFPQLRELALATGGGFVEAGDAQKLVSAFRGVAIGLAHGRVRVFGKGSLAGAPKSGVYRVTGKLLTLDPNSQRSLESAFEFQTRM